MRTYSVPLQAKITVDQDARTVTISAELNEVASDLQYDYDFVYPDDRTIQDQQLITDCLLTSPSNFSMTHEMKAG